jgi:hypothetical protein
VSWKLSIRAEKPRWLGFVLGKVGKGIKCSVVGCGGDAIKSVSPDDVSRAGLRVSTSGRGYLCKTHYKEMKKKTKKDKQVERWRFGP